MINPPVPASAAPPRRKTQPVVTGDVVQLALRQRFNPIRGLTPQVLSNQLDNFHLGYLSYCALTWDAIERRDDVLKGVAAKRKKDVARLKREVLALDGSAEAAAHAAALTDFYDHLTCVNALDLNERGGFPLLVRQMMDAVGKKYAVHEIVWRPGETSVRMSQVSSPPSCASCRCGSSKIARGGCSLSRAWVKARGSHWKRAGG